MGLDSVVVNELRDRGAFLLIYMNEYHVPISAFTFHADPNAIKSWLEKFREAQVSTSTRILNIQRLTFHNFHNFICCQ